MLTAEDKEEIKRIIVETFATSARLSPETKSVPTESTSWKNGYTWWSSMDSLS